MNELNIFKYGIVKRSGFRGLLFNIGQFFRNCKYAWQRAVRGYCDCDMEDLGYFYGDIMLSSLKHLRSIPHKCPGIKPWETPEKWNKYLDEIIEHLKYYTEEGDSNSQAYQEIERQIAIDMINECWKHLWT